MSIFNTLFKIVILFSGLLLIAGCSSGPQNFEPQRALFLIPPLEKQHSVSIGEPMLAQGISTKGQMLSVHQEASSFFYKVKPGIYTQSGVDQNYIYFSANRVGATGQIHSASGYDPNATLKMNKISKDFQIVRPSDMPVGVSLKYDISEKQVFDPKGVQETLIYLGKTGNKININYLKYVGDMSRPVIQNKVEYDLSESNEIAYKKSRIKVERATNTEITYFIQKGFQ